MASFSGLFGSGFGRMMTPEQLRALQAAKGMQGMQGGGGGKQMAPPAAMQKAPMAAPASMAAPQMDAPAFVDPSAPAMIDAYQPTPMDPQADLKPMAAPQSGGLFGAGWRQRFGRGMHGVGDALAMAGAGMQGNLPQYMEQREGRMRRERLADWARTQKDPMAEADPEAAFEQHQFLERARQLGIISNEQAVALAREMAPIQNEQELYQSGYRPGEEEGEYERFGPAADAWDLAQAQLRAQGGTNRAPPAGYRWTADGNLEAVPGGPADLRATESGTRRAAAMQDSADNLANVISSIDQALPLVNEDTTGVWSTRMGEWGLNQANVDLQAAIDPIKANLGFEALAEMRRNSETGGALGQVAVQELAMLQRVLRNLETSQSGAQLAQNLQVVRAQVIRARQAILAARAEASGGQPQEGASPAPQSNRLRWNSDTQALEPVQ